MLTLYTLTLIFLLLSFSLLKNLRPKSPWLELQTWLQKQQFNCITNPYTLWQPQPNDTPKLQQLKSYLHQAILAGYPLWQPLQTLSQQINKTQTWHQQTQHTYQIFTFRLITILTISLLSKTLLNQFLNTSKQAEILATLACILITTTILTLWHKLKPPHWLGNTEFSPAAKSWLQALILQKYPKSGPYAQLWEHHFREELTSGYSSTETRQQLLKLWLQNQENTQKQKEQYLEDLYPLLELIALLTCTTIFLSPQILQVIPLLN